MGGQNFLWIRPIERTEGGGGKRGSCPFARNAIGNCWQGRFSSEEALREERKKKGKTSMESTKEEERRNQMHQREKGVWAGGEGDFFFGGRGENLLPWE